MVKTVKKVLFVTSFHPDGAGNIGAGEAISGDNIRRLQAAGTEVHVFCVAPNDQRASTSLRQACASYTVCPRTSGQTLLAMVKNVFRGSLFAPWFFTRVSPHTIARLQAVMAEVRPDEVWFDFPSSLGFVCYVEAPKKVYIAHDVVSQKIRRSLLKRLAAPMVSRVEAALLNKLSRLVVLSDKDRQLAQELGFAGDIDIWPPSHPRVGTVDDSVSIDTVVSRFGERANMVFFGHMGRAENHWSMVLFILGCYGKIRRACPDVRLWIVGIQPRVSLRLLGKIVPGVEVVGAVDDPSKAFVKSTVCIAPILFGAGVKIKVLQMLDAGASVVATPAGAEGIMANERLTVVDWAQLPTKLIAVLKERRVDA